MAQTKTSNQAKPRRERRFKRLPKGPTGGVELLLIQSVEDVGEQGDVVCVKPGYALNYLIPQGLATIATEHHKRMVEKHKAKLLSIQKARLAGLRTLAAELKQQSLTIEANANEEGHLYGSVGATVNAPKKAGITIVDQWPEGPLKEPRLYTVKIHVGQDVDSRSRSGWSQPLARTRPERVPRGGHGFSWRRIDGDSRTCGREARHARVEPEILDRPLPQNLDAERGVLGSLLLDPVLCDEVALILRAEDFYADAHRKLYHHMITMHGEGGRPTRPCWSSDSARPAIWRLSEARRFWPRFCKPCPLPPMPPIDARIVRDKSTLRSPIHASTEILRDAYDPAHNPRELVGRAEERIFAVHDERSADQVANMHDVLVDAFAHIDHRLKHGGATGIPTGFTDFDSLTGGLHDSELVILAARPSMGKTALATNIADHVAVESNVTTLMVSLEMARLELAQRMLCSRGRIDGHKFRAGYLSSEDREDLVKASAELSKAPLFIDDSPSRTVTEIAATARRLKRRNQLGLVVIDYLQLIEPENPSDPRQEQVAKIARRLKGLARELKVPVLCLAQLNRQAEATKDNRPRMSHLRESGAIEQDADVVMFVHREEYYMSREESRERDLVGKAELIVAKQRNGPTDDVKLTWRQEYTRFENRAVDRYDEFNDFQGTAEPF